MDWNHYFPLGISQYVIGGGLIGLGIAFLYLSTGRQGGVSTFFSAIWSYVANTQFFQSAALLETRQWRLVYSIGLILGGAVGVSLGLPAAASSGLPAWKLLLGGLLIGFGARLGGGCTSGHGICGMASLSLGSLLMVGIFLITAMLTANLLPL